ncbi:NUDIX domain-containing protein [Flavobacterium sp.]|uniref:NUDIX domain-containing protein n=1 Tax=Flavobacterium sp. TaxID=239 RepID=UPI001220BB13|nr:NUDIX domain-containing protein [Flavobacterium sp.]RZJ69664.1 MAG: NUDIX domain-containing protein [Flavobacterium sp.]
MSDPKITIRDTQILSDKRYSLKSYTLDFEQDGKTEIHYREVFDRGNGASILLYNPTKKTVILTRQFRLPAYLTGHMNGMLIETCAGTVDKSDENPTETIRREVIEETGYHVENVKKVFSCFVTPGAVTEMLHCFVAECSDEMRKSDGGGLEEENEHIEVLEMPFEKAVSMIYSGEIIDAKTILLLQYAQIHNLLEVKA